MYIADMHCDSLLKTSSERGLVTNYNTSNIHPQLQFFAAFVPFEGRRPEERRHELIRLFNTYLYETERLGLERIDNPKSLISAKDDKKSSALFSIEGGGGLLADSEELFTLYRGGLRIMGLAWDTNELAASAFDSDDTGLTKEGIRMAKRLSELGITVDASHLSDKSFYELLEVYPLPIIATHSNFRKICDTKRNLTYDMAKEIANRGGVIGLNLYPRFLNESGDASSSDILRHIDYALENLPETSLAFGFDIDGTDGLYPKGFSEARSLHDDVIELLLRHYSENTVRKIAGENVLDFLAGVI